MPGIGTERVDGGGHCGEIVGRQLVERGGELRTPFRRVELVGQPLRRDGVEADVAMRVAAGGEDEHRAAASRVQLAFVDRYLALHEPAENDRQLARARVELGSLELLEPSPDPGSHRSRLHSNQPYSGTWGIESSRGAIPCRHCSAGRSPSSLVGEYGFETTELEHPLEAEALEDRP